MANIIIVGAGISGLATAWFLRQQGHAVTVYEAQGEAGGSIRTLHGDGYLVDTGPTSTLLRDGPLGELVDDLMLDEEMVEADRASATRYIVKDDRLVPLPTGAVAFLSTPLFSPRGKLRMMLEPMEGRATAEESVAQFVRRRLGQEFLDWAIDPFVSGVYAGDPERLSVRAATPRVYALEVEHRSLFIGALARLLRGRAAGPAPTGRLISFRTGMQALPRALASALTNRVLLNREVHEIVPLRNGGWIVRSGTEENVCDRLVLALPADRAAELLAPRDARLAETLREIAYAPVASIALGFARSQVSHPLDGFGMLIPRRVGRETLGALFSSTLFPGRAPPAHVLLTAFIGGARNPAVVNHTDAELVTRVLGDLGPLLGIRGDPAFARTTVWRHAIPQYELGHLDRISRIDVAAARFPRLHFRASWRGGISVSDCVLNARTLAARIPLA